MSEQRQLQDVERFKPTTRLHAWLTWFSRFGKLQNETHMLKNNVDKVGSKYGRVRSEPKIIPRIGSYKL